MITAATQDKEYAQEDEEYELAFAAATIIAGAELAWEIHVQRCNPSHLYLCHSQLLPNPCVATPWQALYNSQNDQAFITTMGFNVETFGYILLSSFATSWYTMSIPRNDTNILGDPRLEWHSLDAAGALGLVVHYLNSTMQETSLQQILRSFPPLSPSISHLASRFSFKHWRHPWSPDTLAKPGCQVRRAIRSCHTTPSLTCGCIWKHWWTQIASTNLPWWWHWKCHIQWLAFRIFHQLSDSVLISRYFFHIGSQFITDDNKGVIIGARTNAPGSWHDSCIAQSIYKNLHTQTPDHYYLVADTAFPQGAVDIQGHIQAPLKDGQRVRGTLGQMEEAMAFNWELLSYWQTAEWGMWSIQESFGRLGMRLDCNDDVACGDLIEICLRLHNLRTIKVGINQIHTVYMWNWQDSEEDIEVWTRFEEMLFSEQRTKDRVACFHVWLEYE